MSNLFLFATIALALFACKQSPSSSNGSSTPTPSGSASPNSNSTGTGSDQNAKATPDTHKPKFTAHRSETATNEASDTDTDRNTSIIESPQKARVLLYASQFDPDLAAIKGTVIATYTVKHTTVPQIDYFELAKLPFEAAKKIFLDHIIANQSEKKLTEGITAVRSPNLASIAQYRDLWNAKQDAEFRGSAFGPSALLSSATSEQWNIVAGKVHNGLNLATEPYFGSLWASIIGFRNPNVEFVLVDDSEKSPMQKKIDETECVPKEILNFWTRLISDPDAIEAVKQTPPNDFEKDLDAMAIKHRIDYAVHLDQDFDILIPKIAEKISSLTECDNGSEMVAFTKAVGNLEAVNTLLKKRALKSGALMIQQSGEGDQRLDSPADFLICNAEKYIFVGAIGNDNEVLPGTNFGKCVDVFAPGQDVGGFVPDNYLVIAGRTVVAMAVFTRYLTQNFPAGTDKKALLKRFKKSNYGVLPHQIPGALIGVRPEAPHP